MTRSFLRGAVLLAAAVTATLAVATARAEETMSRGEYLARAADCVACHSVPGGKAFTGGLKMGTPLGAVYSTNITPETSTGIGNYSLQDFDAAVRRGVARDGHRLYPVMPYPSYAKLTDADVAALYDYFMKQVPPVRQANIPSEVTGIASWRWPMMFWNLAFGGGPFRPDPAQSEEWNRGAYLVQGPGHCGACHTPRGFAYQEQALDERGSAFLTGAPLDGWYASNLHGDARTGLGRWSVEELASFLGKGHGAAAAAYGSMVDVVNNSTPYLSDADLKAMAVYLKSLPAVTQQAPYEYDGATTEALRGGKSAVPGAALYAANCAACHGMDGKGYGPYLPALAGNPGVMEADPSSLINLTLNGSAPLVVKGAPDGYRMPQYRVQMSDAEIASVLSFVRGGWGNHAPPVTADQVKALRTTTDPTSDRVIILKMR